MLDVDQIDDFVLSDLERRFGLDPDDPDDADDAKIEEVRKRIERLTPLLALEEYLAWNGIIGYAGMINRAINSLRDAEIEDDES